MSQSKTILVIGTYDTKDEELHYVADCIRGQGGAVMSMDVSVLGAPSRPTDISKHQVAEAGGSTIQVAIDSEDENTAMQIMARGAALLCGNVMRCTLKLWAGRRTFGVSFRGRGWNTRRVWSVSGCMLTVICRPLSGRACWRSGGGLARLLPCCRRVG